MINVIAKLIERAKERFVFRRYYALHKEIFAATTTEQLIPMEEVIEKFYYTWAGYIDDSLLTELCTALNKSLYSQNLKFATKKFSTV